MKITSEDTENNIRIYINDVLHLLIRKDELVNVRSYYISADKNPDPFFIELTYRTTKVICQYDNREKWMQILNLLNKVK